MSARRNLTYVMSMTRARRIGTTLAALAIGTSCALLPVLAAQAATATYWNGDSFQNETHFSSTVTQTGGSVVITLPSFDEWAYATVQGESTHSGQGSVTYTLNPSRTTKVYCQWRSDLGYFGDTPKLTCKYTY